VAVTLTAATGLNAPDGLAFDSFGDLYVANTNGNSVSVVGVAATNHFGQVLVANHSSVLTAASGVSEPTGLVFDSFNDLVIADISGEGAQILPALSGTRFGQVVQTNTIAQLIPPGISQHIVGIAFLAGNLFTSNVGGSVAVIPGTSSTVFGKPVTYPNVSVLIGAFSQDEGMAVDSAGNLFIADPDQNAIYVYPAITGTLFGQSVVANVLVQLNAATGLMRPTGLTIDAAGNLWIASIALGAIDQGTLVLPRTTGTIFGQSVTANIIDRIFSYVTTFSNGSFLLDDTSITFDSEGDVFIASYNSNIGFYTGPVIVIPTTTKIMFGQQVFANVPATINPITNSPLVGLYATTYGMAVDGAGNLFITDPTDNRVEVLANVTGTIFGQSVTANTFTELAATAGQEDSPMQLAFDGAGNLYITNANLGSVQVLPVATGRFMASPSLPIL
jgi:sugar lactone lactonase YvrE